MPNPIASRVTSESEIDWTSTLRKRFLSKPGEHLIEVGITGSGKTQGLYHVLNGILDYSKNETILWITCGKSAEELKLLQFMPCHFLFPHKREVVIRLKQETMNYSSYAFTSIPDIFRHIDKGKINILCLEPYFPDPEEYAVVITLFFQALIVMAKDGLLPTPLAIFIDEFQMVAPARGQALNDQHAMGGRWMQRNLDYLRSIDVRIVAAAQAWKKVLGGVRMSFGHIMIRQGAEFPANELKRLAQANERWQALAKEECVFAFRNRFYSDTMAIPPYGDGMDVGSIQYIDHTGRQRIEDIPLDEMLDSMKKGGKKKIEDNDED
jgi:hypothetical protein